MSADAGHDDIRDVLRRATRAPGSITLERNEIRKLPLRAIIALGTRCVRRVQPFYRLANDDPFAPRLVQTVELVLAAGEQFAAGGVVTSEVAEQLVEQAKWANRQLCLDGKLVTYSAVGIAGAILAATSSRPEEVEEEVTGAVRASADSVPLTPETAAREFDKAMLGYIRDRGSDVMHAAARADYDHLVALNLGQFPELGGEIDPTALGPLGPFWPQPGS